MKKKITTVDYRSSRKYKVPGGIIKVRWFRKLQLEHARILKSLNYYKNNEVD